MASLVSLGHGRPPPPQRAAPNAERTAYGFQPGLGEASCGRLLASIDVPSWQGVSGGVAVAIALRSKRKRRRCVRLRVYKGYEERDEKMRSLVDSLRAQGQSSPVVILARPVEPGNIGAVARAMLNFGLCELRLVAPLVQPW
ncbi:unnamed protein product, partial [Polarella glacialis]